MMMKNRRVIGFAAILVADLLVASVAVAAGSYGSGGSSGGPVGYGAVRGVVNPVITKLEQEVRNAKSPVEKASAEARLEIAKTEDIIEQSKEERKKRNELGRVNDQLASVKGQSSLFEISALAKARQQEAETQKQLDMLNALNIQTPGISGQGTSTGDLGALCAKGVDFSQFKQVASMMGNEVFSYLRKEAGNIFDTRAQKAAEESAARLQEMYKGFKAAAKYTGKDDFQKNIQDMNKNYVGLEEFTLPKRLQYLDKQLEKKYASLQDAQDDFSEKLFTKWIPEAQKAQGSIKEISAVANNAANLLSQLRDVARNSGVEAASTLKANCDNIVKAMSFENPLAPDTYSNAAIQTVKAAFNPDGTNPKQPELVVANRLQALAGQFKCTDAPADIEQLYGTSIDQALNILRQSKDGRTLVAGMDAVMKAVSSAQSNTDSKLSPLKDDCKKAEAQAKALEAGVNQLKEQAKQNQLASAGGLQPRSPGAGVRGATGQRPGTPGRTTHSAGTQSVRR